MSNFTLVTGLWDLGRGNLGSFGRSFDHYLDCFDKLLSLECNMVVYIPEDLLSFVKMRRSLENTDIIIKNLTDFDKWFPFFDQVQNIRQNPTWYQKASWLEESPQAKLPYYNPVVMSKFFMLNDAAIPNRFGSKYLFWIDGGLANTVSTEQLQNVEKLPKYMQTVKDKFLFLSFPYETTEEVHGFEASKFNEFCNTDQTKYVCRGGFFGGTQKLIQELNGKYYVFLHETLEQGYMGTEENFHTMFAYRLPSKIHRFELEDNGLVYKFFDELKSIVYHNFNNVDLIPYNKKKDIDDIKTSLYVLSFNSPEQFRQLLKSFEITDPDFLSKTRKILVDNSTDRTCYDEYNKLCEVYGFEHIKKENNIGICGGRQFVAEHFHESDSEYYLFFEDDMTLCEQLSDNCKSGLKRWVSDLYRKTLSIIHKEHYDYLKLTFTEFYGDNATQCAWYNIPQDVREAYFPDHPHLPEGGQTPNLPKIDPHVRKRHKDLYYLQGDYFYCNWPLWMSRAGNWKVFLQTKYAHPYEQTWMSHVFQLQKQGKIKCGVLELSPINHHRFAHYESEERIEF